MLRRSEDFPVIECVTRHYFDDVKGPGWRWYCLTCDTGTQVRKHGRRLHKLEGDAMVGAKYHRNQKRRNRQGFRWRAWWYQEMLACTDVAEFEKHWLRYHHSGFHPDMALEEKERIMREIQADPYIQTTARAWAKHDEETYGHLGGPSV